MALLDVRDLKTSFKTDDGIVQAVDGVSFSVEKGKTLAIVGESGCGKSVTCLSIMGLNPRQNTITSGEAMFKDRDLLTLPQDEMRKVRGNEISMIFQDPMTSLNPVHSIGRQLIEAVQLHENVPKQAAQTAGARDGEGRGHPAAPTPRLDDYPHQFSGGMRQRVMIAMSLINNPDLLIADEPTTALDVTTQAQILKLMNELQRDFGSAIILITHDLGVVAETADDVLVMYAAKADRAGRLQRHLLPARAIRTPGASCSSLPRLAPGRRAEADPGLAAVAPAAAARLPVPPAVPYAFDRCRTEVPPLVPSPGPTRTTWTPATSTSRPSSTGRGGDRRPA